MDNNQDNQEKTTNTKDGQQEQKQMKPLFDEQTTAGDNDGMLSFADGFRDKVRELMEYFDKDQDGHLKYDELRALQAATEGVVLSEEMYVMACKTLNCHPSKGISLEALKFTYASEGADIDKDYGKIFGKRKGEKETTKEVVKEDGDDDVYEVGKDGVDISS
mmetsp:Transcript_23737/g.38681  ORF Transcript_23737/g.38681 Transcript_23737/m.38681 type:complete len:162 (+) Transcript_23737:72-557(+)